MGTQTTYFEVTLHVGITFKIYSSLKLFKSPTDYFKMNLHASIAYRLWFSLKGHPKYILIILKWPYMWVLHLRLGLHLKWPKSHMGVAFRAKYSYNFAILPNSKPKLLTLCIINATNFALCSFLDMLNHTIRWINNFENMNFMMYWQEIKYLKNNFMFHG